MAHTGALLCLALLSCSAASMVNCEVTSSQHTVTDTPQGLVTRALLADNYTRTEMLAMIRGRCWWDASQGCNPGQYAPLGGFGIFVEPETFGAKYVAKRAAYMFACNTITVQKECVGSQDERTVCQWDASNSLCSLDETKTEAFSGPGISTTQAFFACPGSLFAKHILCNKQPPSTCEKVSGCITVTSSNADGKSKSTVCEATAYVRELKRDQSKGTEVAKLAAADTSYFGDCETSKYLQAWIRCAYRYTQSECVQASPACEWVTPSSGNRCVMHAGKADVLLAGNDTQFGKALNQLVKFCALATTAEQCGAQGSITVNEKFVNDALRYDTSRDVTQGGVFLVKQSSSHMLVAALFLVVGSSLLALMFL